MNPTPSSPGHQLELAHSLANDAIRAVAMQHHRINEELPEDERFFAGQGFRQEADLRFMLVALRWLREASRAAAAITNDPRLADALHASDASLPPAKDMRDVSEHVADYIRGRGTLQDQRPQARAKRVARGAEGRGQGDHGLRLWRGEDDASLTFAWVGMEINTGRALAAAETLYAALRDALERRNRQPHT
jgi:hypothetical protein